MKSSSKNSKKKERPPTVARRLAAVERQTHQELNVRIQTNDTKQKQHQLQSALISMEFGFKCCEKGMNLEAARQKLIDLYQD